MANFDPTCSFPVTVSEDELMAWVGAYADRTRQKPHVQKFRYFEQDVKGQKAPFDVWAVLFLTGSGELQVQAYFFRRDMFSSGSVVFDKSGRWQNLKSIPIKCVGAVSGRWPFNFALSFSSETRVITVVKRDFLPGHDGFSAPVKYDLKSEVTILTINLNYF